MRRSSQPCLLGISLQKEFRGTPTNQLQGKQSLDQQRRLSSLSRLLCSKFSTAHILNKFLPTFDYNGNRLNGADDVHHNLVSRPLQHGLKDHCTGQFTNPDDFEDVSVQQEWRVGTHSPEFIVDRRCVLRVLTPLMVVPNLSSQLGNACKDPNEPVSLRTLLSARSRTEDTDPHIPNKTSPKVKTKHWTIGMSSFVGTLAHWRSPRTIRLVWCGTIVFCPVRVA